MPHIIGKQIIDLHLPNAKNAFTLQHRVSQLFWQRIAPELERVFDQIADDKTWIRIDRLAIDLGNISSEQLLAGSFLPDLKRKLQETLEKLEKEQPQEVKRTTVPQNHFQQWLYFLENGFFKSHQLLPEKNWEPHILESLEKIPANIVLLQKCLQQKKASLNRLARQHSPVFYQKLIAIVTGLEQAELIDFIKEWQQLLPKTRSQLPTAPTQTDSNRQIQIHFWQFILKTAISKKEKRNWAGLIGAYLQNNF